MARFLWPQPKASTTSTPQMMKTMMTIVDFHGRGPKAKGALVSKIQQKNRGLDNGPSSGESYGQEFVFL